MKVFKLHRAKRFSLTSLSLLIILVAALKVGFPFILPALAQPTIAVDPMYNIWDPPANFTVDVTISGVADLFSYEVYLGFDEDVLEAIDIQEGPFIKEKTTSPMGTLFSAIYEADYVYAACVTLGNYPGVGGSGTLFNVTFTVMGTGESPLHLYDSILLNPSVVEIPHDTSDGNFYTLTPHASFSFTPDTYGRPIVGENVTFDAGDSYDLDGTIDEYFWNFSDGTTETLPGSNATVTHVYNQSSTPSTPYNVSLTVTDNDGRNSTVSKDIHVKFHDIAIVEIDAPDEVFVHESAKIDVTVLNNGSHWDKFNVTTYINYKPIGNGTVTVTEVEPGKNETVSFDWYTYVNSSYIRSSNITTGGNWIYPHNASASDDLYTYCNTNNTSQDYTGYHFYPAARAWTGIAKVEVGIEVKTDTGGNDQIDITVYDGKSWGESHIYDIASTTDRFFWVDVTGDLSWPVGSLNFTKVRIQYIQRGIDATPIYVDWLRVRVSPLNPIDVPPGTYDLWAYAYLVDPESIPPYKFREGEEADISDNTLFGNFIKVSVNATHDMAVTNVEVSPTEIALEGRATVEVKVKNEGNVEETFDVLVYANSTEVGRQIGVKLLADQSKTFRFDWLQATNSTVEGVYNVTVMCGRYNATTGYITPLINETDTTNNKKNLTVLMRLLPAAFFTFSPSQPAILEEATFNASASYAPGQPGGTINQYIWDFDDGTTEIYTGANLTDTTTHTYRKPDKYAVKLTVVDNEDLSHTKTSNVVVPKWSSTVTMSALPTTVPVSLNTTISGSIKDVNEIVRANATVAIDYTRVEETAWYSLANLSTNDNGQYSFVWLPTEPGAYQIKASWGGDATTLPAESSELNVNVIIQDTAIIDVVLSKIKVTSGESLAINVTATNRGTATETFNVSVYYNNTLLETQTMNDLAAGANEIVSFSWDTQGINEGAYMVRATAETLPGETSIKDNSLTSHAFIQGVALNIYLYTTIGLAIAIAAMTVYLVMTLRKKPK